MTHAPHRHSLGHLMRIGLPLAVLGVALGMTLWVTNTPGGERFAENDRVGPLIFLLWVAGGIPLLVRLARPAKPQTPTAQARRVLAKVVWSAAVVALAFQVAGVIWFSSNCWECIGPGQIVGSIVAFGGVSGLGLWVIWHRSHP